MAVLLSRVHTASLVALIPGAELARTASTALVLLVIASLVAIAAWAPRVPLWAGRVCPLLSHLTQRVNVDLVALSREVHSFFSNLVRLSSIQN